MRFVRIAFIASAFAAATLSAYAEDAVFKAGDFTFIVPPGWQSVEPASPMRKAELRVSGPEGTGDKGTATVTVFHFGPGEGGSVEQNIDRWFGQFGGDRDAIGAATAKETLGKTPATFARARGTFQSGMPGGPTTPVENQALLGVILESPRGDVYVKMTGPAPTVERAEPAFVEMIRAACSP